MARKPQDTPADSQNDAATVQPSERALIRELAQALDESNLTEIEIERAGFRLRVARNITVAAAAPVYAPAAPAPAHAPTPSPSTAAPAVADFSKHPGAVPSPMVGTAYWAPAPGAKPFIEVGSTVKVGDTLLIIEAMKTMNQIPSPIAGTVTKILVEDGQPVEFGEPLVVIE
ncbi:MAG TPA: acetyl-CoA carboxylase biotin carboxyl carrier protein [Xanthobacteraceae bacterium]|nr:acetyl-CoA carboxylase biotin carboxyl carrier protein [Xanthobacteraceae bacterium]